MIVVHFPVNYLVTQVIPHSRHWFPVNTRTSRNKNLKHGVGDGGGFRNTSYMDIN